MFTMKMMLDMVKNILPCHSISGVADPPGALRNSVRSDPHLDFNSK